MLAHQPEPAAAGVEERPRRPRRNRYAGDAERAALERARHETRGGI